MNSARKNRIFDIAFKYLAMGITFLGLLILFVFLFDIFRVGLKNLDVNFLINKPSFRPSKAGILTAWTGTLWVLVLTAAFSIPMGIGAGLWLEEYGKKNKFSNFLEINIANLAGIPSIIYGILGLQIFSRTLKMGGSLLAGSFTLALLILPIIIVVTREAIKAVPKSIKEASYGLGASKWQTISKQILPAASGNIITGVLLALARAIGEAAPLIVVGALTYVPFVAKSPLDEYTVLPMQIFNWISRPQKGFIENASSAIVVLLLIVFVMNGVAIYFRTKSRKKLKW